MAHQDGNFCRHLPTLLLLFCIISIETKNATHTGGERERKEQREQGGNRGKQGPAFWRDEEGGGGVAGPWGGGGRGPPLITDFRSNEPEHHHVPSLKID